MESNITESVTPQERKEWMYDAFISYRHIEPDAYVAGAIHKLLEAYKPPKSIYKGKSPEEIKRTKIKKVFRDQEELPLTSNLSDTISMALENSEYLIVICSPRFGESLWCRKEVETFISLHGKEKVLTVLVDGEPSESFPEALLYREIEVKKEDGTVEIVKEPIEPLAANARGNSNQERYKLLKTETLRLMAPMFGVNFDDLKQRHKEQKFRRTIQAVAAVAGICFLFGVVSTTLALKINRQNVQITEQNQQITEQSGKISEQAFQIRMQYYEALLSKGESTTQLATSLYEDGDRVEAVKAAYSVFPHRENDVPYIQSTQRILTDALALYDYGDSFLPDRILKAGSVITESQISPNGKAVAASDEAFGIYVWDSSNGRLLAQKNAGDELFSDSYNITFRNDTQIYTTIDGKFVLYDFEKDKVIFELDEEKTFKSFYNEDMDRVLIYNYDKIILADGLTGEVIAENDDCLQDNIWSSISTVSDIKYENQKYYAYIIENKNSEPKTVIVRNLEDGSVVKKYDVSLGNVTKLKLYDDTILILDNEVPDDYFETLDANTYISSVYRYDFLSESDKPVWIHSSKGSFGTDVSLAGTGKYVSVANYSSLELLEADSGEVIRNYNTDDQIQSLFSYQDQDNFAIVTRKGIFYTLSISFPELIEANFFQANVSNMKSITVRGGIIATVPYSSTEMTLYRTFEQTEKKTIFETPDYIDSIILSEDSNKLIAYTYDKDGIIFDRTTGNLVGASSVEDTKESEEIVCIKEQYIDELGISSKAVADSVIGANGRLFAVIYKDRSFDLFRISHNEVVVDSKEHFSSSGLFQPNRIEANKYGDMILIVGTGCGFILDLDGRKIDEITPSEKMIVAEISGCKYVDFENEYVYCTKSREVVRYPLYSRQAIADAAQKELALE